MLSTAKRLALVWPCRTKDQSAILRCAQDDMFWAGGREERPRNLNGRRQLRMAAYISASSPGVLNLDPIRRHGQ